MSNAKELQLKSESNLSAKDLQCKRYIELKDKIKAMEKEVSELRKVLEHEGTHSTRNFVVTVDKRESLRVPPKAKLLELYPDAEKHLVKVVQTIVTVQKKD